MNDITLKQLEAFYWAATCSNFAIAADKLHISQSSLSKRLRELEDSLGRPLFDRSGRRAVLTPHGAGLVPGVRALLDKATELAFDMQAEAVVRGRCRLGVGEIAASSWLPRLVAAVRTRYPELTLEPYVDLGMELEARLLSGSLDAAMIARHATHPALDSVVLARVDYVWVAAPHLAGPGLDAEELATRVPIVSMSRQAGSTRILDTWRQQAQVPIHELIECNSMVTMAGLVAAGLAIGYLPIGWLRPLLHKKVLVTLPGRVPLAPLEYRFHWRTDDTRPLIARLRDLSLEAVDYDTPLLTL